MIKFCALGLPAAAQLKVPLVSDDSTYPFTAVAAVGSVKVYEPLAGAARVTTPAPAWFNGIGI
jgi:hypothetical protein